MKHIKAIIKPEKLSEVREAVQKLPGYGGAMINDIMGQGTQKGITQAWRGEKFQMDLLPKVSIDLVVRDEYVEAFEKAILENAYTGEIGDGKIFVYNVEEVIRIRTGEKNEKAL